MFKENKVIISRLLVSLVLFVLALTLNLNDSIQTMFYVVSYLIIAYDVLFTAGKNIIHLEIFDEKFLMSIATIGAFAIGEYPEAVLVMLLYQFGEFLQDLAVDHSMKSISSLMDIRPDYARVKRSGEDIKVSPEEVMLNDIIVIYAGEKVPLDGIIVKGDAVVDTKSLTGESMPLDLQEGSKIISGSINMNSVIEVKVTSIYEHSTVKKILDLLDAYEDKKSKSVAYIEKFARYYTPIVVALAVFIAVVPSIITGNVHEWVYRSLVFLVVSCPCALVISVPLTFFAGLGASSKKGVLVKGGNYLETLAKTKTIVFDKTGTLTKGNFNLTEIHPSEVENKDIIKIIATLESFSNHPIAKSIVKSYEGTIDKSLVSDYKEISGYGIQAKYENDNYLVGNKQLMIDNNIYYKDCHLVGTIIHLSKNNIYLGHVVIEDVIKNNSKATINELHSLGIKTVMLTGDRKLVAEDVSKKLGIDESSYELLPIDKVNKVEELINENEGSLAFVGDGINDAPVLVRSDVGIAMGAMGSESAIAASDIVIMNDDPLKIIGAIKVSRKTIRIANQNIAFALGVKIIVLILGVLGIADLGPAVFADTGVTLLCVFNAMRVYK